MEYTQAIVAGAVLLYALVSGRLSRTAVSGTLLFAAVGLVIGPEVLDVVDLDGLVGESEFIRLILTMTLVVVLFTDACAINSVSWREDEIPARLLGVGMPLTIVAGAALALVTFTELAVWEAAVLGVLLAPTDAALGKPVVSNPRVPQRIRQALNVESGLNDGVALPLFVVFVEAARIAEGRLPISDLVVELLAQIGIAVAVGAGIGALGIRALRVAAERDLVESSWAQIALVAMAALAYTLATPLGGSGFIAAWVAGLVFGLRLRNGAAAAVVPPERELHAFSETAGDLLTMVSFLLFGLLLGPTLPNLTWSTVLYAVAGLTVIRVVPVLVSQLRSGLAPATLLYLGWFGPRGLATILLALEVAEVGELDGAQTIYDVALFTVALSVLLHGATAWWGSNAYADHVATHPDGASMAEHRDTATVPTSRRVRTSHGR